MRPATEHWKHWTPEEIAHLRRLAEDGLTRPEAAAILGRSYSSTKFKAQRLGIHFPWEKEKCVRAQYAHLEKVAATRSAER